MATEQEVGRALAVVMPLFSNYKPPRPNDPNDPRKGSAEMDALVKAWHMVIGHLEPDVLSGALRAAVTRTQFFPTPSLVLECAVELTSAPKRTGLDAWGDVKRAIAEHGSYHPPNGVSVLAVGGYAWTFEDALVGKVVAALGWRTLCMSENEMADRARFVDAYEQEQRRSGERERLTPDLIAFQGRKQQEALRLTAGLAEKLGRGKQEPV